MEKGRGLKEGGGNGEDGGREEGKAGGKDRGRGEKREGERGETRYDNLFLLFKVLAKKFIRVGGSFLAQLGNTVLQNGLNAVLLHVVLTFLHRTLFPRRHLR